MGLKPALCVGFCVDAASMGLTKRLVREYSCFDMICVGMDHNGCGLCGQCWDQVLQKRTNLTTPRNMVGSIGYACFIRSDLHDRLTLRLGIFDLDCRCTYSLWYFIKQWIKLLTTGGGDIRVRWL